VSILDNSNENILDFGSSDCGHEINNANERLTERSISDSRTETGGALVSKWLEVTDLEPGTSRTIPLKKLNTKQLYHQVLIGELNVLMTFIFFSDLT
jgi:hypothetical protein